MSKDYEQLVAISKRAVLLHGARNILTWDQETHMPDGGAATRAEVLEVLSEQLHEIETGRRMKSALGALVDLESGKVIAKDLKPEQKAALREWHRDYRFATKLPKRFVSDFSKLTSEALQVWKEARKKNKFSLFAPYLERIVTALRKKADLYGYKAHPYDALLDEYERDSTTKQMEELLGSLVKPLQAIRKKVKSKGDADFLTKNYSCDKQLEFSKELICAAGYDPHHWNVGLSTHPFCSGSGPGDVRITTRCDAHNPFVCFSSMMHEAGHALYDQQLSAADFGTPLGSALSMSIHESQSKWWEAFVGQSLPFWQHYFPKLQKLFPTQLGGVTIKQFYGAMTELKSTPIRIDSDELAYPLHIYLRFEIERDLIAGKMKVKDLPQVWREKMKLYHGFEPKTDSEGCLQDVHWAAGYMGYFPSYTLGNLYAASFFATFAKEHPDWEKRCANGDFEMMRRWLKEKIHKHGRRYTSAELVKRVTGAPLSSKPYLEYLSRKY